MIAPKMINQRELIPVKELLNSRGFKVKREGENGDLLLPKFRWPSMESHVLFQAFDSHANRDILKNLVNDANDNNIYDEDLKKLIQTDGFHFNQDKYAKSFEWYIGELLVKKFSAFSYSYSVEVENIQRNSTGNASGDFDVLAVLRNINLIYVECKSGKFRNLKKENILKCIERGLSLHCELSIMVVDDLIDENHLKYILKEIEHPLADMSYLIRINIKDFKPMPNIYEWGNCFFISSKENIEEQLRTVFRINEARKIFDRYTTGFSDGIYSKLGYNMIEILK